MEEGKQGVICDLGEVPFITLVSLLAPLPVVVCVIK